MLRAKDYQERFVREGAKRRLAELEAEREMLLQIIGGTKPKPKVRAKAKKRGQSKHHWTQTAEGRAKMSRMMKAKYAAGWKKTPKAQPISIPTAEQQLDSALPDTDQSTH